MNSGSLVATSNSLYDGSRGRSILLTRSRQFLDVLYFPYSSTDKSTVSSLIDVECRIIEVERECNSRREKKRSLPERRQETGWLAGWLAAYWLKPRAVLACSNCTQCTVTLLYPTGAHLPLHYAPPSIVCFALVSSDPGSGGGIGKPGKRTLPRLACFRPGRCPTLNTAFSAVRRGSLDRCLTGPRCRALFLPMLWNFCG